MAENDLLFEKMEQYALDNSVPIITKEGLDLLILKIKEVQPKNILEIGTAIGYSALKMSEYSDAQIITVEREDDLVDIAKENIQKSGNKKIKIIHSDFLELDLQDAKYDFVYVDGAKAQYYNFFKHFENNIHSNTVVLFDNLDFHDYVFNDLKKKHASKNLRQLIQKLEKFIIKIQNEDGYDFEYIKKGDGIGILKRKTSE